MVPIFQFCFLLSLGAAHCFRITSKIESAVEPGSRESSSHLYTHQRSLDPPYPDYKTYEAIFAGIKKPISVDCTQPDVICKFPLVVADKDIESVKPIKSLNEGPLIIKGAVTDDAEVEKRENSEEKEESADNEDVNKVPIIIGSFEIENIAADEKSTDDNTWLLEKNSIDKKYKIPVKLIPSKSHTFRPIFPPHQDFHDHFGGGDPYQFVVNRHGSGYTPWMRAYPSVYNYPSNQPCQPPVYHQPPPCTSSLVPSRKPTVNIDDKIDKEEE